MSGTDASRPSRTFKKAPRNSSKAGESSTSAATPAAERPATPESRAEQSDQAPRAGKRSPGLKSIEAAQAIAKIGQEQDGPPPPSTPLEIASSELWPELLILDFAAYEARSGLAGLFACQAPLHRTMYEAGPEAYKRDLEAYAEECQRSAREIERWRALLKRHALSIGSLSLLRELCAEAYDLLAIREEWGHLRAKEPWRDWLHNREVVDRFFGVRMPARPVVDLDCAKLVTSLFDVVYELSAGADRPPMPAAKKSVSEALAAFDSAIAWCDDAVRATLTPETAQATTPANDVSDHAKPNGSAEVAASRTVRLTAKEAASYVQVTRPTMIDWIKNGGIWCESVGRKHFDFNVEELEIKKAAKAIRPQGGKHRKKKEPPETVESETDQSPA